MEAGHADAARLSVAQLTAVFKLSRRERALRDRRALMIAAAGASGGKAFDLMCRTIEKELKAVDADREDARPTGGSEIPLNQADFEKMMQEE